MTTDLDPEIVVADEWAHGAPQRGMQPQDAANRVHRRP